MPAVSVILPTYNRSDYLEKTVDSVLEQTFGDWELIVIDDGSTDGTDAVIRRRAAADARIRGLRQNNQGSAAAKNRGLAEACGKYVAFLDDDDLWFPEKLEIHVRVMEASPETGLTYSGLKIIRNRDRAGESAGYLPRFRAESFEEVLAGPGILNSMIVVRGDCLKRLDGFNPAYRIGDDWDLLLRFVQGGKMAMIDEALAATVKDGRQRVSEDLIASSREGLRILKALPLRDASKKTHRLMARHAARVMTKMAYAYLEAGCFGKASEYFFKAFWKYPLVGLMFRKEDCGRSDLVLVLRSFVKIPFYFAKGIYTWLISAW